MITKYPNHPLEQCVHQTNIFYTLPQKKREKGKWLKLIEIQPQAKLVPPKT